MRRVGGARLRVMALVVVVGALMAGCSASGAPSTPTSSPSPTPAPTANSTLPTRPPVTQSQPSPTAQESITDVVALGDSVPAGTACGCNPYPELSSTELGAVQSTSVHTTNEAVPGFQTTGVIRQLEHDETIRNAVRHATIIELEIGANDVGYNKTCGTTFSCYEPKFDGIQTNLARIVADIQALNPTRAHLVLLDYWAAWQGGKYAAANGPDYVATAAQVTDALNTIIREQAATSDAIYVDLRAAFKGPNYTYDETHYLAPDGDHPNALGHKRIASATVTAIRQRWDL